MWVQLLAPCPIEINGKTTTVQAGDWVSIHRHLAIALLNEGMARTTPTVLEREFSGAGIVCPGECPPLPILCTTGEISVPYEKTCLWEPSLSVPLERFIAGFSLLDTWEMAAPIASLEGLALSLGTEEERARTARVIRDLRVPYYDTRIIFARRGTAAELVIAHWKHLGGTRELAFLEALYRYKPLFCALPVTWAGVKL